MLKLDVDWAESYTMIHAREIQSEYWLSKQISLFICIGKMLLRSVWDQVSGKLDVGAEVTVEQSGAQPFWAEVVSGTGGGSGSVYRVKDAAGELHDVKREQLRARVWYTAAQVGVSNDKKHDSYATQHFITKMVDLWKEYGEAFTSLHIHSDNAGKMSTY